MLADLLTQYRLYAQARKSFLAEINLLSSCRDPLAEFSEVLVATLLGAKMASSRVQKGYDLVRDDGRRAQVKYLCNPEGKWINEHKVYFSDGVDDYALVIFEGLDLKSVLIFTKNAMRSIAQRLKKRHPHQDTTLRLTQRNYKTILAEKSDFVALGMEIFQF